MDELVPPDDLLPPDDLEPVAPAQPPPDVAGQYSAPEIEYAENTPDDVVSSAGARGRMQVRPATAARPGYEVEPARDQSIAEYNRVGVDYWRALQREYGSPALAAAAYNWGPGNLNMALAAYGDPRKGKISERDFIKRLPETVKDYVGNVQFVLGGLPGPRERARLRKAGQLVPPDDLLPPDDLEPAAPAAEAPPEQAAPEETAPPPDSEAPSLSKGVLDNGMLPGHEGNLDPGRAGDKWATFEVSEEGIPKHYVLPTEKGDRPANDDTGFLGDAVERFRKTGKYYGAFDSDEAGQAFMQAHTVPTPKQRPLKPAEMVALQEQAKAGRAQLETIYPQVAPVLKQLETLDQPLMAAGAQLTPLRANAEAANTAYSAKVEHYNAIFAEQQQKLADTAAKINALNAEMKAMQGTQKLWSAADYEVFNTHVAEYNGLLAQHQALTDAAQAKLVPLQKELAPLKLQADAALQVHNAKRDQYNALLAQRQALVAPVADKLKTFQDLAEQQQAIRDQIKPPYALEPRPADAEIQAYTEKEARTQRGEDLPILSTEAARALPLSDQAKLAAASDAVKRAHPYREVGRNVLELRGVVPGFTGMVSSTVQGLVPFTEEGAYLPPEYQKALTGWGKMPAIQRNAWRQKAQKELPSDQNTAIQNIFQNLDKGMSPAEAIAQPASAIRGVPFRVQKTSDNPIYKKAGELQQAIENAPWFKARPGYEQSPGRVIGEALGSMGAGVGISLVAPELAPSFFYFSQAGQQVQDAVEHGATEGQIMQAAAIGGIPGLTDSLPIEMLLGHIPVPGVGLIKVPPGLLGTAIKVVGKIGMQAFAEGGQEGIQQWMQNLVAKGIYNPKQDLLDQVGLNALGGGGAGAIAEVAALALGRRGAGRRLSPQDQRAQALANFLEGVPGATGPVPNAGRTFAEPPPLEMKTPAMLTKETFKPRRTVETPNKTVTVEEGEGPAAPPPMREPMPSAGAAAEAPPGQRTVETPTKTITVETPEAEGSDYELPGAEEEAPARPEWGGLTDQEILDLPTDEIQKRTGKGFGDIQRMKEDLTEQALGPARKSVEEVERAKKQIDERLSQTKPTPAPATFQDIPIKITTPKGEMRKGVSSTGEKWEAEAPAHYGEIPRTKGADGDPLDVYIGENPKAKTVYVIDQIDPKTGKFDEHKAMLGFDSEDDAIDAYKASFSDKSGSSRLGGISEMHISEFKGWAESGDLKKALAMPEAEKPTAPKPGPALSPEYQAAIEKSNAAGRAYQIAVADYRAKKIGDDEFLKARTAWKAAQAEFDKAYNAERDRHEAAPPEAPAAKPTPGPLSGQDIYVSPLINSGVRFRSDSGRELAPVPKMDASTNRKRKMSLSRYDAWILDEARKEATGDNYNKTLVQGMNATNLSPSDRDLLNDILFGDDGPSEKHIIGGKAPAAPKPAEPDKNRNRHTNFASLADEEQDAAIAAFHDKFGKNAPRAGLASAQFVAGWADAKAGKPRETEGMQTGPEYKAGHAAATAFLAPKSSGKSGQKGTSPSAPQAPPKAPEPVKPPKPPELPAEWGAKNTGVTQKEADDLAAELAALLKGQMSAGLDPKILPIASKLAAFHIEAGARKFADWVQAMSAHLGKFGISLKQLRPHLRGWYNHARDVMEDSGLDVSGMDDAAAVKAGLAEIDAEIERAKNDTGSVPPGVPTGAGEKRPEGVPGPREDGEDQRPPEGEMPGGEGAPGSDTGEGAQGGGRPTKGRPGAKTGGGKSDGTNARPPAGPERPKHESPTSPGGVEGKNFHIAPGALAEERTRKTKALDNIAAIELAKTIEKEGRLATADEQAKLAKYVGWGGLSGAFPNPVTGKYGTGLADIGERLKALLTDDEYKQASTSTQYAHYTAENVINAMWGAVQAMGFKGGAVFEPGMGIGHFLGLMPPDLAAATRYSGIERDPMTALIAKHLYPQSGVRAADYIDTAMPENFYDLAIGNPPFSDTVIKADPKYKARGFALHDYFFAKTLDSVRPGGLLAFVTSAGTMNKLDTKARAYLGQRAEFIGGVRLPSTAFAQNANTEVTTDVLFFKKRQEPLSAKEFDELFGKGDPQASWADTVMRDLPTSEGDTKKGAVSRYFSEHPEMVLGEEGFFDKLYKDRYAVHARPDQDLTADLNEAVDRLPKDIMDPPARDDPDKALADLQAAEKKDGSFYLKDGKLYQYNSGVGTPVASRGAGQSGMAKAEYDRVVKLIPIRDALRQVFTHDLAENTEHAAAARKKLNQAYDAFTREFGPINKTVYQYSRPSRVQQEGARLQAREDARAAGEPWDDGSFDTEPYERRGASLAEIARARQEARERKGYSEGSFDPEDMEDNVREKLPNIDPFMDDPESYRLRAIEDYKPETGEGSKKRVFFESVISKALEPNLKSAQDGVLWSLNKFGRFDLPAIAEKMGVDPDKIIEDLGDSVFKLPGTKDTYQTSDEYLSGDIPDKLAIAKAAAQSDPAYERNASALEAALPPPLAPGQIRMRLGMPWIPPEQYAAFIKDKLDLGAAKVKHSAAAGGWMVTDDNVGTAIGEARWATPRVDAFTLLNNAMNLTAPKVYDRWRDPDGTPKSALNVTETEAAADKINEIKNAFYAWASGEKGDELAGIYNREMNRRVLRLINGSWLTTPGVSTEWRWRPHQQRGVARIILTGNTYLGHAVGAGKTSEMIGAGMEMRRLGLVKKPMYVVPNHMLSQFAKEFYEQYPTAKIMVADDRQFHTGRRKQFMANVAQDDIDAVIITHSSFGMIPLGLKAQEDLINEELANLDEALKGLDKQDDRHTIKRIENQKEKLTQRLKGAMSGRKDMTNTFEEMGVDFLFIDEAHEFRKLNFATRQQVKGIDSEGSEMAWDLYSKINYLESRTPGRSVVLASGTPITNTMAELYTLSRYLQRPTLKKYGLGHFDSWASAFGDTQTKTEPTAAGGYDQVTRFSSFVNMPELFHIVGEMMDIVTSNELGKYVVRPKLKGGERKLNVAPRTKFLDEFQAGLDQRMQAIKERKRPAEKGEDIVLSVIGDGRLGAIDPRLVGGDANDAKNSKLNLMLKNALDIYQRTHDVQFYDPASNYQKETVKGPATQIIFANLGVRSKPGRSFNVYDEIKRQLIAGGVKPEEIAFIRDYKNLAKRQKLYNDMNSGKVRFLIGSTKMMGTGLNVQKRLYAIHNLDPLWYPADDEQRMGRILRQGNMNPEIEAHDYTTKGTYDSAMWDMMGRKGRFIEQFFRGDPTLREMEDLGEASLYEQAAAMSTMDERVVKLTDLKQELEKVERRKIAHDNSQYALRHTLKWANDNIASDETFIGRQEENIKRRVDISGDKFHMTVAGKRYDTRKDATDALAEEIKKSAGELHKGQVKKIGSIAGFDLHVDRDWSEKINLSFKLYGAGNSEMYLRADTPAGIFMSAQDRVGGFEHNIQAAKQRIAQNEARIASITPQIGKPFTEDDAIEDLRGKVYTLEQDIQNNPVTASKVKPKPKGGWETTEPDEGGKRPGTRLNFETGAMYSRIEPELSGLERAVANAKLKIGHGSQWAGVLKNAEGFRESGLGAWLKDQKGLITKARVIDQLRSGSDLAPLHSPWFGKGGPEKPAARQSEQVAIGANIKGLISLYGEKMYGSDMPQVTGKELLQNGFDGVKAATKAGLIKPGEARIDMTLDRGKRTLTVADNGIGMSRQTVKDAFLTIAGTDKGDLSEAERSGGFGVAKLAFIFGNERLQLATVRDGMKTVLDTSGNELLDGKANLQTEPTTEPNGTIVTVTFPAQLMESWSKTMRPIDLGWWGDSRPFLHILQHPLIGDVEVNFTTKGTHADETKTQTVAIGRNQDMSGMPKITTAHFPWGDVDVYMSKERSKKAYPNHQVLSSGLYQFNAGVMDRPFSSDMLPYELIFDVHPKVAAQDAYYPFNNQREGWSEKVKKDLGQLQAFLQQKYAAENAAGLGGTFVDTKTMPIYRDGENPKRDFEFADLNLRRHVPGAKGVSIEPHITISQGQTLIGGEEHDVTKDLKELERLSPKNFAFPVEVTPAGLPYYHNNLNLDPIVEAEKRYGIPQADSRRFFAGIGTIVLDFRDALAKVDTGQGRAYELWGEPGHIVGVSLDKGVKDDRKDTGYHGVHLRVPFRGFFLNPIAVRTDLPEAQASSMMETLFHEATHTFETKHDEGFTTEMGRLREHFVAANPGVEKALLNRIEQHILENIAAFTALRVIFNDDTTWNAPKVAAKPSAAADPGNASRLLGRPFSPREEQQLAAALRAERGRGVPEGDEGRDLRGSDEDVGPQYSRISRRPPATTTNPQFDDAATEERWKKARAGIGGTTVVARAKAWFEHLKAGMTRHWIDLPNVPKYADLQAKLRALEANPDAATGEIVAEMKKIVGDMTIADLDLFTRKVVLDDLQYEADEGHNLPFGLTAANVPVELAKVNAVLGGRPDLLAKLRLRKRLVDRVANDMVDAGVLDAERLKNPAYFRHQVLDYAQAQAYGAKKKLKTPFWAQRQGSVKDINANYIEAEFEWLRKALNDIATAKTIDWIKDSPLNIRRDVQAAARRSNDDLIDKAIKADLKGPNAYVDNKGKTRSPLYDQWMRFRQRIGMGVADVKAALDSGTLVPPPQFAAIANALQTGTGSADGMLPFFGWILDGNHPGSIGAATAFKAVNERRAWSKRLLGKRFADVTNMQALEAQGFAPKGYSLWQPREGRLFFTTQTMNEKAIGELVSRIANAPAGDLAAMLGLPPGALPADLQTAILDQINTSARETLAVGGARYTMILPDEVAATLDQLRADPEDSLLLHVTGAIQSRWKQWVLINPLRAAKYNLNNLIGDMDAVIAGNPHLLTHAPAAMAEIFGVMRGKQAPSQTYLDAVNRGVFNAGITIQEIPDIHALTEFTHLSQPKSAAASMATAPFRAVWRALRDYTAFRENILRYAAYLDYHDRLAKGEPMSKIGYGASNREMVKATTEIEDKAALLARDLIGDYGAISSYGQGIRRHLIPFWSWTEINTKRYWRLTSNAFEHGIARGAATGGGLGVALGARVTAGLLLRMIALSALFYLWNNLLFGDEEDKLTPEQQRDPHVNIGEWAGKVHFIRIQGALTDVLSWLGFQDAIGAMGEIAKGRGSIWDVLGAVAKAPVKKIAPSFTPAIELPVTLATGQSFFPDVFEPIPVRDGWREVMRLFSFDPVYDAITGRPTRGIGDTLESTLGYARDPKELAYDQIRGLTFNYLAKTKGESGVDSSDNDRTEAYRAWRTAARYGDKAAAKRAYEHMRALKITPLQARTSLQRAAPLGAIPVRERQRFLRTLTPAERKRLQTAQQWYRDTFQKNAQAAMHAYAAGRSSTQGQ